MTDMDTDFTLPFGPDDSRSRTWKLDESRKQQARSLAVRLGIAYAPGTAPPLPNPETHPDAFFKAKVAIQQGGGPERLNPDWIVSRKMHVQQGSEEWIFLNTIAGLCGYYIHDIPDGMGGFVLIDPKKERTTAWHPEREIREAACVCGSLMLREAKRRGLAEIDDLANAFNTMAVNADTSDDLMKGLEDAFGHIDINKKDPEVEVINLTQVDLLPAECTPRWLNFHAAAEAAETPRAEPNLSGRSGSNNRLSSPW